MFKTALGRLRLMGYTEGTSFLLLLGVAMPLKHIWGMPMMVRYVGMVHGLLWLMYVGGLMTMYLARSWPVKILLGGIVASVLPFGPFVFDRYLPAGSESESEGTA